MSDRHRSWESLQTLIASGMPIRFGIQGDPKLEIMMEPGNSALSLLIPAEYAEVLPATTLEAIQIEQLILDERPYVRIVTRVRPLYREFYLLCTDIADSVQIDCETFDIAVNERLENWRTLLRSVCFLSAEQQLGLLGELWLLLRLINTKGLGVIQGWTGPTHEPHDFRYEGIELEVKSTRSRQRAHVINGLDQLQASEGLNLYLVSLQFEPANTIDAVTLPQQVLRVRSALESDPLLLEEFNHLLMDGCGYRAEDEQYYLSKYRLRTKPSLVVINDKCPKISRQFVLDCLGADAYRIGGVQYVLNVDELGYLDGTKEFTEILPAE